MDLLWMILLLFLVCAEAEKVTEVKVELGQNVTLNCSGNNSDTHWYMEINHSQLRGYISRSYNNNSASSQFYIYTNITKYTAFGNKLIITNITEEDCRLYFCGKKNNSSIHFVDTIRLVSDVPKSVTNSTIWQNEFVIYSSLTLNILLLVIIGLACSLHCLKTKRKKRRNCNCQMNESSPATYEDPETLETRHYEEIQLSPYTDPPPDASTECVYYKAQVPRSTLPGC